MSKINLKNGEITLAEAEYLCVRHGFSLRHATWPEGQTFSPMQLSGFMAPISRELAADPRWSVAPGKLMPDVSETLTYTEALEKLIQNGGAIIYMLPDGGGIGYPIAAIASGKLPCEERRKGSWVWRDNGNQSTDQSEQDRALMEQACREANIPPPERGN